MSAHGYSVGQPLDLARGVAFETKRNGKPTKVGIRASADRWVAATKPSLAPGGELATVDELLVMTFTNPKERTMAQLWRFDAEVVAEMARQVFDASGKTGQQWLPLDDTRDADVHSMVAGSLAKRGELVVEEPVEWVAGMTAPTEADNKAEEDIMPDQMKLTIAQAKAGLAAHFGVSPASIKITIEG